ncbi:hypothetical protein B0T26DRAFT_710384 [Lasiosphaeria miniovina]|uniref:Uncharacterized protein n=1 Tax=Lasiosphaeria miniovina TaxID=1954250 RepID=A0AA40DZX5_9PEZI|nr:uncharacterized protein B0T26DRAFT_710384 [Lasiosphaeria miniovina]KAK0717618.1 hypothetical protein B0T26DRAFT_710384 [Lasiosphaeria miniovina]
MQDEVTVEILCFSAPSPIAQTPATYGRPITYPPKKGKYIIVINLGGASAPATQSPPSETLSPGGPPTCSRGRPA